MFIIRVVFSDLSKLNQDTKDILIIFVLYIYIYIDTVYKYIYFLYIYIYIYIIFYIYILRTILLDSYVHFLLFFHFDHVIL